MISNLKVNRCFKSHKHLGNKSMSSCDIILSELLKLRDFKITFMKFSLHILIKPQFQSTICGLSQQGRLDSAVQCNEAFFFDDLFKAVKHATIPVL